MTTALDSLRGRIAVVTGGAGAIGTAITKALQEAGHRTVVLDRDADIAYDLGSEHGVRAVPPVCPGALSPVRVAMQSKATAKRPATSTLTPVHGRSGLRCSGHANHRDQVTPPHLPGGKPGSGPPPGRKFQQRIDMGEPAGVLPGEFQPKGDPP